MATTRKQSPDDLLTTAQAAKELGGITRLRVRQMIDEGRLKATRFGRSWVIRRGDLDPVRVRPTGRRPKPAQ